MKKHFFKFPIDKRKRFFKQKLFFTNLTLKVIKLRTILRLFGVKNSLNWNIDRKICSIHRNVRHIVGFYFNRPKFFYQTNFIFDDKVELPFALKFGFLDKVSGNIARIWLHCMFLSRMVFEISHFQQPHDFYLMRSFHCKHLEIQYFINYWW